MRKVHNIKAPRYLAEQYTGPQEPPLLCTVRDIFFNDYKVLSVPAECQLQVMHRMLHGDTMKHFNIHIADSISTAEEALDKTGSALL